MSDFEYLNRRIGLSSINTAEDFPLYFEIETVNACNARCPMCTIDDWQRKSPSMKMPMFRDIADQIAEKRNHVRRVSLYRDGEPLLDKKLEDRTDYLKTLGIKEVAIASNIELMTESRARTILQSGMDLIIVSFDSLIKPVFEAIRLRLNFETCLENLLTLIRVRNQMKSKCKIWVRMIRQDSNFDEWNFYRSFFEPIIGEHDRVYYHDVFNWGGQLDLNRLSSNPVNNQLGVPCVSLWSLMVIFSDGSVPLCNVDYNNKYPLGSVVDERIEDIWLGRNICNYRKAHLTQNKSTISLCAECNVWDDSYLEDSARLVPVKNI